jgi:hypothetical protein
MALDRKYEKRVARLLAMTSREKNLVNKEMNGMWYNGWTKRNEPITTGMTWVEVDEWLWGQEGLEKDTEAWCRVRCLTR